MEERSPEEAVGLGRAAVLADLAAESKAGPEEVSVLEDAVAHRRWWSGQWPQGAAFVPGLIAQDVQDALLDRGVRWPGCELCEDTEEHTLGVEPELGADPHWVCDVTGRTVAPLGGLGGVRGA
ncbi:hypothetical protein [Streptomyces sodiiphilus]